MVDKNVFINKKVIAIIGLSDKPDRESYQVAAYLQSRGFTIIPINPNITEVLGEKSFPTLKAIPNSIHIDIVDMFRKPEHVITHMQEVIERGDGSTIWLQEGVGSQEAIDFANEHQIPIIANMCIMKTHKKIHSEL